MWRYKRLSLSPRVALVELALSGLFDGEGAEEASHRLRRKSRSTPIPPATQRPRQQATSARRQAQRRTLYGQAKVAGREVTDAAIGYAKDAYENGGDTFRDGSQAIAKKVRDNPLGSMLIVGAIGFALALFMTRPPRHPPQRWRKQLRRHIGTIQAT
jgi:hypothetical protein